MTATTLFYIIIAIIVINFLVDKVLDALNAKHFNDDLPNDLQDVYDADEYKKSQNYKATKYKFDEVTSEIFYFIGIASPTASNSLSTGSHSSIRFPSGSSMWRNLP